MRSRQQEREDGELGEVALEILYHALEGGIRNFHLRKVESQLVRADRAGLHRAGDDMITEESAEFGLRFSRAVHRRISGLCRPTPCACRKCPGRARPSPVEHETRLLSSRAPRRS